MCQVFIEMETIMNWSDRGSVVPSNSIIYNKTRHIIYIYTEDKTLLRIYSNGFEAHVFERGKFFQVPLLNFVNSIIKQLNKVKEQAFVV